MEDSPRLSVAPGASFLGIHAPIPSPRCHPQSYLTHSDVQQMLDSCFLAPVDAPSTFGTDFPHVFAFSAQHGASLASAHVGLSADESPGTASRSHFRFATVDARSRRDGSGYRVPPESMNLAQTLSTWAEAEGEGTLSKEVGWSGEPVNSQAMFPCDGAHPSANPFPLNASDVILRGPTMPCSDLVASYLNSALSRPLTVHAPWQQSAYTGLPTSEGNNTSLSPSSSPIGLRSILLPGAATRSEPAAANPLEGWESHRERCRTEVSADQTWNLSWSGREGETVQVNPSNSIYRQGPVLGGACDPPEASAAGQPGAYGESGDLPWPTHGSQGRVPLHPQRSYGFDAGIVPQEAPITWHEQASRAPVGPASRVMNCEHWPQYPRFAGPGRPCLERRTSAGTCAPFTLRPWFTPQQSNLAASQSPRPTRQPRPLCQFLEDRWHDYDFTGRLEPRNHPSASSAVSSVPPRGVGGQLSCSGSWATEVDAGRGPVEQWQGHNPGRPGAIAARHTPSVDYDQHGYGRCPPQDEPLDFNERGGRVTMLTSSPGDHYRPYDPHTIQAPVDAHRRPRDSEYNGSQPRHRAYRGHRYSPDDSASRYPARQPLHFPSAGLGATLEPRSSYDYRASTSGRIEEQGRLRQEVELYRRAFAPLLPPSTGPPPDRRSAAGYHPPPPLEGFLPTFGADLMRPPSERPGTPRQAPEIKRLMDTEQPRSADAGEGSNKRRRLSDVQIEDPMAPHRSQRENPANFRYVARPKPPEVLEHGTAAHRRSLLSRAKRKSVSRHRG